MSRYGSENIEHARKLGFEVITMHKTREIKIEKVIKCIHNLVKYCPAFLSYNSGEVTVVVTSAIVLK